MTGDGASGGCDRDAAWRHEAQILAKTRAVEHGVAPIHRRRQCVADVQPFEIEEGIVREVRRNDVLQRREHRFCTPRITLVPLGHHLPHLLALKVVLRTAEIARDDREPHAPCVARDLRFAAISERPDDHMRAIVGEQLGRHGLQLAAEEKIEEQGMDDIVAVMPERDLVGAQFLRSAVDDASAQTRTANTSFCPRESSP